MPRPKFSSQTAGIPRSFPVTTESVCIVHGSVATGRMAGRGAYLCRNVECLRKAQKAKRLERAFECPIPDEVMAKLEEELTAADG